VLTERATDTSRVVFGAAVAIDAEKGQLPDVAALKFIHSTVADADEPGRSTTSWMP